MIMKVILMIIPRKNFSEYLNDRRNDNVIRIVHDIDYNKPIYLMACGNYRIYDQTRFITNDLNEWKKYKRQLGYKKLPTPYILNSKHTKKLNKKKLIKLN